MLRRNSSASFHFPGRNIGYRIYGLESCVDSPTGQCFRECLYVLFSEIGIISQTDFFSFSNSEQFQEFACKIFLRYTFDVQVSVQVNKHGIVDADRFCQSFVISQSIVPQQTRVINCKLRISFNPAHDHRKMRMIEPNHPFGEVCPGRTHVFHPPAAGVCG
ncbi:hypothetical protein D3C86_1691790 [compost metagenome]